MALQHTWAELDLSWVRGRLRDAKGGVDAFQLALAELVRRGNTSNMGFFLGLLAQLEEDAFGVERALARVDEALALTNQGEIRYCLAFLHRLRGDLLLKRDPWELSLAEQAFRAAIAIAKQQGARSFALQASLALAKVYQSTNRLIEAHAVLTPAIEGFAPTPEMPEIADAQGLLEQFCRNAYSAVDAEARREHR
jgi:predicted ATPase